MISLITYELKNRQTSFLFVLAGALWLFGVCGIMKFSPDSIVATARLINQYHWLRTLLGITEPIESVTYELLVSFALVPLIIVFFYKTITGTANTLRREDNLGTIIYFLSIPVSRTTFFFIKVVISFIILVIELAVLGILVWNLSFHNAPDHEFFYTVITENVTHILTSLICGSFLAFCIGIFYGGVSRRKHAGYFTRNLLFFATLLAFLPNILYTCALVLTEKGYDISIFSPFIQKMAELRNYNPLYWSNATVSTTFILTSDMIRNYAATGILLTIPGYICYRQKKL